MAETPVKFPKRKPLPYSISVCTTHQKENCRPKFVTATGKTTKAQRGWRIHRRKLTSYVWDEARSEPRDPFLCCLFSDMVLKECENLALQAKRKRSSFGAPFGFPCPAPRLQGNSPCGSWNARLPGIGREHGSSNIQETLSSPSSYLLYDLDKQTRACLNKWS